MEELLREGKVRRLPADALCDLTEPGVTEPLAEDVPRFVGVGGMGDDIWRELVTKDNWDSVDDAWAAFRKQLELGREIEVVDENGERIQFGD